MKKRSRRKKTPPDVLASAGMNHIRRMAMIAEAAVKALGLPPSAKYDVVATVFGDKPSNKKRRKKR